MHIEPKCLGCQVPLCQLRRTLQSKCFVLRHNEFYLVCINVPISMNPDGVELYIHLYSEKAQATKKLSLQKNRSTYKHR